MLKDGSYAAITGGIASEVKIDGKLFVVHFPNGVRGFNYKDTVTVLDGKISSSILGEGGIIKMD